MLGHDPAQIYPEHFGSNASQKDLTALGPAKSYQIGPVDQMGRLTVLTAPHKESAVTYDTVTLAKKLSGRKLDVRLGREPNSARVATASDFQLNVESGGVSAALKWNDAGRKALGSGRGVPISFLSLAPLFRLGSNGAVSDVEVLIASIDAPNSAQTPTAASADLIKICKMFGRQPSDLDGSAICDISANRPASANAAQAPKAPSADHVAICRMFGRKPEELRD